MRLTLAVLSPASIALVLRGVRFGKSQRLDAQHCAKEMLRWCRYATVSLAEDGPVKQMMQGKKVCCV